MPFETRVRISLAYPFCWLPSNCICHAWWQCWIEILPMSHVVVMHSGSEALWLCYRKWWVTVKFEIVRLNCSGIQESLRACANLEAKGSRGLRLPGLPWKPEGGRGGGQKKKEEKKKTTIWNWRANFFFFFFCPRPPPPPLLLLLLA